jgi:possible acetyltransferase
VKEEFQNRGVGKSLINFLMEYSKSNNIQDIFVDTEQIDNEDAIERHLLILKPRYYSILIN